VDIMTELHSGLLALGSAADALADVRMRSSEEHRIALGGLSVLGVGWPRGAA